MSHTLVAVLPMDGRRFAHRVRIGEFFLQIQHHTSRDELPVYRAFAYDTPQFERFFAYPFTNSKGYKDCLAHGASREDLLVAAGLTPEQVAAVIFEWDAQGEQRSTGQSYMSYASEARQFVVGAVKRCPTCGQPIARE